MTEQAESLCLLYLDDSAAQLAQFADVVRHMGHEACGTSSIQAARKLLSRADIVVIDFHMPNLNGAQALDRLRDAVTADRVRLFLLYTTDTAEAASYQRYGFDGALTRKGDVEALRSQLDAAIRRLRLKRFMQARKESP